MTVDLSLARAKLYAAIGEQAGFHQQPFTLRPSNIGQCPLRLQFEHEDSLAGKSGGQVREPRHVWSAYQGEVAEELIALLLGAAGAEIVQPPHDSDEWMEGVPPDPETGFRPHIDSLIRWPEVGLSDWAILELKDLRTMAHLDLLFHGLYQERVYWYQIVSYLRIAELAMRQYAAWEEDHNAPGPWTALTKERVTPQGIFFVSTAKDPATANMMAQQQLATPGYETDPPKNGHTQKQLSMMALREAKRQRFEANDSDAAFYLQYVRRDDPSVVETWDDIVNTKRQVELSPRAEPLHNIAVPEAELADECRWYCPYLERHRNMGLTLLDQLGQSVREAREEQEKEV